MTTQAKEAASSAVDTAGDALDTVKARAAEGAGGALGTARQRAREQVDRRSTQAGERAAGTAADVRSVSEELRKQGKEGPAKVADQAAERIERAGAYLREADADTFLGDVERIGRERPWAIAAAGLAIGIVAGRALKASSGRRYSQTRGALPSGMGSDADARPSGLGAGAEDAARPAGLGGR